MSLDPTRRSLEARHVWISLAAWLLGLLASLYIHDFTRLDFVVQDLFYRAESQRWLVDSDAPLPRLVFYRMPKWFMIAAISGLAVWLVGLRVRGIMSTAGRSCWMMLLCLTVVPAIVGLMKKYSGVWCPSELVRYGGSHTFHLLFAARPAGVAVGCNFPAGHATAGFAWLGLRLLPIEPRWRVTWGFAALTLGWVLGAYQMLKGAHFLSHTLATMCIAGAVTLLISQAVERSSVTTRDRAMPGGSDAGHDAAGSNARHRATAP